MSVVDPPAVELWPWSTTAAALRLFMHKRSWLRLAVFAAIVGWSATTHAWIYPEHRQISAAGWRGLSPEVANFYGALWTRAREGSNARLCEQAISHVREACIDFSDWPALAGDHSCSPEELVDTVLPSRWVHDVARTADDV
ncbi:MAG: hypothetical protein ABW321_26470, partial [Polyangiales bacterium]